MNVAIAKYDVEKGEFEAQAPCWVPVSDTDGNRVKPLIVCNCGETTDIGLHHVHADGRVTASYFHQTGCGWHVYLTLQDYNWGEFLPNKKK